MDIKEQIYRSRQLMCESNDDKISLLNDFLNDMLPHYNNTEYKVVREFEEWDDNLFYFTTIVTMDSSMYHQISPNYSIEYKNFIILIRDKIDKLVKKYLPPNFKVEVVDYDHKNVNSVIKTVKPLIDKAFDVYSEIYHLPTLPYKFITSHSEPGIIIYIDNSSGLEFNHSDFLRVLLDLYPLSNNSSFMFNYGLLSDFTITTIKPGYKEDVIHNINESVIHGEVICDNCGWSWELSDGGNDPYTCHKCGQDNSPS